MELISTGEGRGDRPGPGFDTAPRRGGFRTWSFTEALFLGQAPDGGLFVPASIPPLPEEDHAALAHLTFPERAFVVARHFLADEVADEVLRAVVHDALDFPVPLHEIEPGVHLLELFHGPTHSFKDVGARFMARMMSAGLAAGSPGPAGLSPAGLPARSDDALPVTILTATSGDTGGAVAQAFHGVSGVRVLVFFPDRENQRPAGGSNHHAGGERHRGRGPRHLRRLSAPRPAGLRRPVPQRPAGADLRELDQHRPAAPRRRSTTCTRGWNSR